MSSGRARSSSRALVALVALVAGCDRFHHDPPADAGPGDAASMPLAIASAAASASGAPAEIDPRGEAAGPPVAPAEAARRLLHTLEDDPALVRHRDMLRAHFDVALDTPLEEQAIPLPGDRRAVLLTSGPQDRRPIVLALDAAGKLLWTKARPLAGIRPGTSEMALTTGPNGQVVLIWFDQPTQVVAERIWDTNGGIFADFQLLTIERCTALSALYWPHHGWVIAAAAPLASARIQLLDEAGGLGWGRESRGLPWASRSGAAVTLALDTDESVVMTQVGDAKRGADRAGPDRIWAMRYDGEGAPLWKEALEVATIARAPAGVAVPRIEAARKEPGAVELSLPKGASRASAMVRATGVVEGR
ncbi:MAG: hypothetical protein U0359_37170 [Byssovorax sp.]